MTTKYVEATPAYGRTYENKAAVLKDWHEGKDFILRDITSRWDGKPFNNADATKQGFTVILRDQDLNVRAVVRPDGKEDK